MELAKELLGNELGKMVMQILEDSQIDYEEIAEAKAIRALQKIKSIIENDSLSDFDCVENIVSVFEEIGSDGGNRHDF